MVQRVVVVGGDAAGMTAASQALRHAKARGRKLEVVAVERTHHVSYSACGIPYWVAGDVDGPDPLIARSVDQHRRNGIDLRIRTEATALDLNSGHVEVRALDDGTTSRLGYDHLVLATGAIPVRPPVPGIDSDGIFGVQTLDDGERLLARLCDVDASPEPRRAVVVGAGYIGVEMAEALVRHGYGVTVVDKAPEPMTSLDPDMGALVHTAMEGLGIDVRTDTGVEGFDADADGRVCAVLTDAGRFEADVVVLGLGVRPLTTLAKDAGIALGDRGGIRTDLRMAVPGHDGVWAAGDCVEVRDRVALTWTHVPLGTHANKQGRVIGINLGGGYATFPGVVGTAVSKVCDLEIARTGLSEAQASEAGFRYVAATIESTTRAGYFPGTREMTVKMLAEVESGRLLGAQIVGREGSAKRIDTCATALWARMAVEDLTALDLAYAPPFSPVWDPVGVAARKAADLLWAHPR